jgi:hypothetical protein
MRDRADLHKTKTERRETFYSNAILIKAGGNTDWIWKRQTESPQLTKWMLRIVPRNQTADPR